jgi:hypothetical protein
VPRRRWCLGPSTARAGFDPRFDVGSRDGHLPRWTWRRRGRVL